MKKKPLSLQECLDDIRRQYRLSVPVFQELVQAAKKMNQCNLCHSLIDSTSNQIELKCPDRHLFHTSCLFPLFLENGNCPVCHFPVLSSAQRPLDNLTSNPTGIFVVKEPAPAAIINYATNTTLYRYNAEGIDDFGWGCAWRSIQTCLSHYGITISIADLYHRFGREESMVLLHRQLYPNQPWTMSSSYADQRGWANPIIGQLILHAVGIQSDIFFVNGIIQSAKHYSCPILNFHLLQQRLVQHFQTHKSPVMIDDDLYAMTILGIGIHDGLTSLLIGDPHIMPNITIPSLGIYVVILDEQGNFLDTSLTSAQKKQMLGPGSYEGIRFARKNWIVLFPTIRFGQPVDDLNPYCHLSNLLS